MKIGRLSFFIPFLLFCGQSKGVSAPIDHAVISMYAVDTETKKVLIDINGRLSLIPSSCMKVVTTVAALGILGENYQFTTDLEYDGEITEGVLHGNIYIKGSGDPCLGSSSILGDLGWKKQIDVWADAIGKLGIVKITGRVIGDSSKWEKASAVGGWSWEDLGNYYGAGARALSFHENMYSLFLRPGKKVGDEVTVLRTEPPVLKLLIENELKTGSADSGDLAWIYGSEGSFVQSVRGTIPAGVSEFFIKGAIPDPAKFCSDLLTAELGLRNIAVEEVDLQPNTRTAIHTTYSPEMKRIVRLMNEKSVNLYAEHLLKKMGELTSGVGSSAAGISAVTKFFKGEGVNLEGFKPEDGSGLSRKSVVTAKNLTDILVKVKESPVFPVFFESLPKIKESLRAKTGTMSQVRGLSGYLDRAAFTILINGCTSLSAMKEKIEELLLTLSLQLKNEPQP